MLSVPFFSFVLDRVLQFKYQCGCLHGEVIENGLTRNRLTLWTVHVLAHQLMGEGALQYWVTLRMSSWGRLQQPLQQISIYPFFFVCLFFFSHWQVSCGMLLDRPGQKILWCGHILLELASCFPHWVHSTVLHWLCPLTWTNLLCLLNC